MGSELQPNDRELINTRVVNAPLATVFDGWTSGASDRAVQTLARLAEHLSAVDISKAH